MKLETKIKKVIRKDSCSTCAYVYLDGVAVREVERHWHKGKEFSSENTYLQKGEIKIFISNSNGEGPFKGRLVFHNPTLLLDGIDHIHIYRNNKSQKMEEIGLTCDTVTVVTNGGIKIHEDIHHFMSADICIQNSKIASVTDWEKDL